MKYLFTLLLLITNLVFAQSESIIEELIQQYPQLSNYAAQNTSYIPKDNTGESDFYFYDYTEQELLMLDSLGVLSTLLDTVEIEESVYFGYKFFNTSNNFVIFDNIPIPGDYRLGPGDQLSISIWGTTQLRSSHMINRDGDIFVDGIGQINLTGMNITTAENLLKDRYSAVYSTIKGKNPTTFLSASLGQLKSNNISFVGEVLRPGIHAVHPFSDITTALLQAGGVDTVGSLRNIQVIRGGEIISEFDFYEFLVAGKTSTNIRLINGDVIFVPVRQSTVEIIGEVNRPGIYETKKEETIDELINYAGGLTPKAQPRLEIYELQPRGQRTSEDYAFEVSYIDYKNAKNEIAYNLTQIRVLSVPDVTREISVLGQVKMPGIYAYQDSMKLLDILRIAGGLDDETFLESIYTERAMIIRQSHTSKYPTTIPFNINKLLEGNSNENFTLKNNDIIIVRENSNYSKPQYITLSGQIKIPGQYTLLKDQCSLDELVARAGGFTEEAYVNGLQMFRDSVQVVLHGTDICVSDGDSVYVPLRPGVVKIFGEVQREGTVQYVKGKTLRYYIERAGGFTLDANKKQVVVGYANGDVRLKRNYLFSIISVSPPIKDGSTIYVYRANPKIPFDITQFLAATASTATSIATLYLLYQNSK